MVCAEADSDDTKLREYAANILSKFTHTQQHMLYGTHNSDAALVIGARIYYERGGQSNLPDINTTSISARALRPRDSSLSVKIVDEVYHYSERILGYNEFDVVYVLTYYLQVAKNLGYTVPVRDMLTTFPPDVLCSLYTQLLDGVNLIVYDEHGVHRVHGVVPSYRLAKASTCRSLASIGTCPARCP
jgi:hypothetical protein